MYSTSVCAERGCTQSAAKICLDGSSAVEIKILNKFNLGHPGRPVEKHKCKV